MFCNVTGCNFSKDYLKSVDWFLDIIMNILRSFNLVCLFKKRQKMRFSVKDFSSKCNQICRKLRIWLHLLKKSLIENFSFCALTKR